MNSSDFRDLKYYQPEDVPNYEMLQSEVVRLLDNLVGLLQTDRPLKIISGYRSLDENRAVGGSGNSRHLTGEAADVIIPAPYRTPAGAVEFFRLADRVGFNAHGFYFPEYTAHLDIRPRKPGGGLYTWARIGGRGQPYIGFNAGIERARQKTLQKTAGGFLILLTIAGAAIYLLNR